MLALINDIHEISKIEAGRITLNPTTFDLHALLDDMEAMFRIWLNAGELDFSVERGEDVPRYMVSDESKPRQILINLLGNAVKLTARGGVSLSTAATHETPGGARLVFRVEDAGIGIADGELENIFKPFEQNAPSSHDPDTLAALDPELAADLKRAIITGSPDRIAHVSENIRMNDPAFADALKKLVDGFEYEKILSLIQEGRRAGDRYTGSAFRSL
ncbi:MAG: hypothetical protein GY859_24045 [Desulfobacterales bacterium]|nr:hypothetical protein [Desulfobacterales bacterium]